MTATTPTIITIVQSLKAERSIIQNRIKDDTAEIARIDAALHALEATDDLPWAAAEPVPGNGLVTEALVTVTQAAAITGVNDTTLQTRINRGTLPYTIENGVRHVAVSDIKPAQSRRKR